MSEFNPNDPFALFGQMFKQGANPFMPPMSAEEIERRLLECRTVEQWLTMQLGMVQMTIKTLEFQKAGLAAFQRPNPDSPE
ncbi:PhaM family polyhydroxyalkanoate granule multifunctional regulatory protein [Chitinibacteraceae bacterium HSL-7]